MEKPLLELRTGAKAAAETVKAVLGRENAFVFLPGEKERRKTLDFLQSFSG